MFGAIVCAPSHQAITLLSFPVTCLLATAAAKPWVLAFAVMSGTLIHEDIATITAGALVAQGVTGIDVALPSLYVGIVLGDVGLYGLGSVIARLPASRCRASRERFSDLKVWLDKRLVAGVFAVRFLPGLRLPAYTTFGFFAVPFHRFLVSVIFAVSIWTTGLFYLSYEFGQLTVHYLGLWQWPAVVIAVVAPLMVTKKIVRGRIPTDAANKQGEHR